MPICRTEPLAARACTGSCGCWPAVRSFWRKSQGLTSTQSTTNTLSPLFTHRQVSRWGTNCFCCFFFLFSFFHFSADVIVVNWHALKRAAVILDSAHQPHSTTASAAPVSTRKNKKISFKKVSGKQTSGQNSFQQKWIYASKGTAFWYGP